jgi:integral membrane protein
MKNSIAQLRLFSVLEGVSYIVLFSNMLLIKPFNPELYHKLLYPIGLTHGVLFVIYVLLVLICSVQYKWKFSKLVLLMLVSFLPFGTFWSEKKLLRNTN